MPGISHLFLFFLSFSMLYFFFQILFSMLLKSDCGAVAIGENLMIFVSSHSNVNKQALSYDDEFSQIIEHYVYAF